MVLKPVVTHGIAVVAGGVVAWGLTKLFGRSRDEEDDEEYEDEEEETGT